jgi:phospholipid/cholesterol/gamma-HCH transport system substrate-binding protein
MTPSPGWLKTRRRLAGVVFLAVAGLLVWLSVAAYNKQFTPVDMVTLHTDSAGSEMHPGNMVLYRGAQVGEVRSVTSSGAGATLELAITPGEVAHLPVNVTAEMLPTTLFGERYVSLIPPASPAPQRLTAGTVIQQDRSSDAIEIEKVLNDVMPVLTAVQPAKLAATLTAVAQALQDRGGTLGQTIDTINSYLKQFNPYLPTLDQDITKLVQLTRTYSQAAPAIVQALNDFTVTSRTLTSQQQTLNSLYATVTGMAQTFTSWLNGNQDNIIQLSGLSKSTLQILEQYAPEFPCLLQQLVSFEPAANKALGAGTSEPGLHATVSPVQSPGRYDAPGDNPVYRDNTGPHCYPIPLPPGPVVPLHDGTTSATTGSGPGAAPAHATADASVTGTGGLGLPNSPGENELINELMSSAVGTSPSSLPDWSSVLTGPVFRGTDVSVSAAAPGSSGTRG